jgi:hypothetical protein
MAKNISVPDELYYLIKYFKDEMNCTFGEALYWILDNSQYFPPTLDEDLGYAGGQWYNMVGRMRYNNRLKPLEANPREWHKARGAAQDTYQQEDLLAELSNMLDGR